MSDGTFGAKNIGLTPLTHPCYRFCLLQGLSKGSSFRGAPNPIRSSCTLLTFKSFTSTATHSDLFILHGNLVKDKTMNGVSLQGERIESFISAINFLADELSESKILQVFPAHTLIVYVRVD